MRVYVPIGLTDLAALESAGALPPGLRACTVDPAWRAGAVDVDEEEWEYEAAVLASEALPADGGVLLALDVELSSDTPITDGWLVLGAGVSRRQLAAVLGPDLAWYGVQEIGDLLADH